MLDFKYVRENADDVRAWLASRNAQFPLDEVLALDERRRQALTEVENLKAKRNEGSKKVGELRKSGQNADALQEEMRALSDRIKELDVMAGDIDGQLSDMMLRIPNRPDASVPAGPDETGNVQVRTFGTPRAFDFEPKPHWELGEALGIMDFERAVKVAESRFVVLYGAGARLERALTQFMLDRHTQLHGYTEVCPPFMVNSAAMQGTGNLPKFAEDLYKCSADDLWMIPTAEVPLTNLKAGEILKESELPICYTAYTPCFRREAGSYGRDMRGMLRVHQFEKVEMVKICRPEDSFSELEKLTRDAEDILQALGLPYRTVCLCTGDMGFASAKTYDLEVWLPSQGCYREISSCSNCCDFQARRMNTRYRPGGDGKPRFVHTLNGSGIAVGRCLIAVMENYQQADGSVLIPEALVSYMGTDRIA